MSSAIFIFSRRSESRTIAALGFVIIFLSLRLLPSHVTLVYLTISSCFLTKQLSNRRLLMIGFFLALQSLLPLFTGLHWVVLRQYAEGIAFLLLLSSFFRFQDLQFILKKCGAPQLVCELLDQMVHSGMIIAHSVQQTLLAASLRNSNEKSWLSKVRTIIESLTRSVEKSFFRLVRVEEAKSFRSFRRDELQARKKEVFSLRNISQTLDTTLVLLNINFDLSQGEWVGVIGSSGAGKTSLLRLLAGASSFSDGDFNRFGLAQRGASIDGRIQLLFQDPMDQIIGCSPREDLRWSYPEKLRSAPETEIDIESWLQKFGVLEAADRSILSLSAGERKRLSIASLCPLKPKVLLLDEPTSGLDASNSRRVLGLLEEQFSDSALLWVTHEYRFIPSKIRRFIVMSKGQIIFDGLREDLIGSNLPLEELGALNA